MEGLRDEPKNTDRPGVTSGMVTKQEEHDGDLDGGWHVHVLVENKVKLGFLSASRSSPCLARCMISAKDG